MSLHNIAPGWLARRGLTRWGLELVVVVVALALALPSVAPRALDKDLLSVRLEYRFDRSTGPEGGYFEGEANALTRDQHLLIAAVVWRFDSAN